MAKSQTAVTRGTSGGVPDLVPVRMLNEFTYCPRLAYLEWVQGEFEDNADTIQGRHRHRRVDKESGGTDEQVDKAGAEDVIHARSLMLSAETEGLIARMDIVEFEGNKATPVDYKRGAVPDIPEKVWEPERVQLCAQGLILRENGYECDEGVVYFVESRTRVVVPFDEELVARTRSLLTALRETAGAGTLPLYVQEQGAFVGKSGATVTVKRKGELLHEARLLDVSQICLMGNVQVSTQAVREFTSRNIPVLYFTYGGWLSAITRGLDHKNVELRLAQYEAASDAERSLAIAKRIVAGKIYNSRIMLRRNHKGEADAALDELRRLRLRALEAPDVGALLGLEGAAARVYFSHLDGMLRGDLAGEWNFRTRNRRPPRDPVNALLSFAYALLTKDALVALSATGFDPYLGVYHAPKYGKPALALDLVEEFRPILADSVVIGVINNEEVTPDDFVRRAGGVALKDAARKRFIAAYERRMQSTIAHPLFGYTISYRRVLAVQARLLARAITGEIASYPSFATR